MGRSGEFGKTVWGAWGRKGFGGVYENGREKERQREAVRERGRETEGKTQKDRPLYFNVVLTPDPPRSGCMLI